MTASKLEGREVNVDVEVKWAGDLTLTVSVGGKHIHTFPVTIQDIQMDALVRVKLGPLLNDVSMIFFGMSASRAILGGALSFRGRMANRSLTAHPFWCDLNVLPQATIHRLHHQDTQPGHGRIHWAGVCGIHAQDLHASNPQQHDGAWLFSEPHNSIHLCVHT